MIRSPAVACFLIPFVLGGGGCSRGEHASGASPGSTARPAQGTEWLLQGNTDERFARVAKQLRGFDVAMVETGHRYTELYWAGRDGNFEYAAYQVEKIRTAVENGVERRPKRATSAKMLEAGLLGMEEAIKARDQALFAKNFETLTVICNACHQAERVPFVTVTIPTQRLSPVRWSPPDGGADAADTKE